MPRQTRLQLQQKVGDLIGDPNNTRWSTSKVQAALDEAQEAFAVDTRCLTDTFADSIVAGTAAYSLPAALTAATGYLIDIRRVTVDDKELDRSSPEELHDLYGSAWITTTGTPTHYMYDDLNRQIKLYPIPNVSGTTNLDVEYFCAPQSMDDSTDYPLTNPTGNCPVVLYYYHPAVAYKAAANLLRIQPDQQKLIMAKEYEAIYDSFKSQAIENAAMLSKPPFRMTGGRYFR